MLEKPSKSSALASALALSLALSSCTTGPSAQVRSDSGVGIGESRSQAYNGPKARLAVVKFIDKSGANDAGDIGSGLTDMLISALFQTNRYIILDRSDLDAALLEQDLAARGRVDLASAARMGEIEGAELLVFGAITEYQADVVSIGGVAIGIATFLTTLAIRSKNDDMPLGAVTYKASHIALDLKVVDSSTGRILHAGSVEGRYNRVGGGIIGTVGGGATEQLVTFGGFRSSGAEEAARIAIEKAVENIVRGTPPRFYHQGETLSTDAPRLLEPIALKLPRTASARAFEKPSHQIISDQPGWDRLMRQLKVEQADAPKVDWRRSRVVALFGGKRATDDWIVHVRRVVKNREGIFITATLERTLAPIEENSPNPPSSASKPVRSNYPFELIQIGDRSTPIKKLTWE